jgi:hypothetical protein
MIELRKCLVTGRGKPPLRVRAYSGASGLARTSPGTTHSAAKGNRKYCGIPATLRADYRND